MDQEWLLPSGTAHRGSILQSLKVFLICPGARRARCESMGETQTVQWIKRCLGHRISNEPYPKISKDFDTFSVKWSQKFHTLVTWCIGIIGRNMKKSMILDSFRLMWTHLDSFRLRTCRRLHVISKKLRARRNSWHVQASARLVEALAYVAPWNQTRSAALCQVVSNVSKSFEVRNCHQVHSPSWVCALGLCRWQSLLKFNSVTPPLVLGFGLKVELFHFRSGVSMYCNLV